jgi:hypothetical protein
LSLALFRPVYSDGKFQPFDATILYVMSRTIEAAKMAAHEQRLETSGVLSGT